MAGVAAITLYSLVAAGIYHLLLLVLGGGTHPFETTYRVVSYSVGGAVLLAVVPVCGPFAANLIYLALVIIGFMPCAADFGQ